MTEFNLPISFLDNKNTIQKHIIDDIELLDNHSLYKFIFTSDNKYALDNLSLWSNFYTSDKDFLLDSQKLLKYNLPNPNYDYAPFQHLWNDVISETSFIEKYQYLDSKWFHDLNYQSSFLQILSLYNMTSPVISLALPILFLIFPFFILKLQGISLTPQKYIEVLKMVINNHQIGQLFNFNSVSWDKRFYILVSTVFYFVQIYQNVNSCRKFYKNIYHIHNSLLTTKLYLQHTIKNMQSFSKYYQHLPKYQPFISNMNIHKDCLIDFFNKINLINFQSNKLEQIKNIGHYLKCFFELYNCQTYKHSIKYSFGFNGYIINLNDIADNVQNKNINFCKFTNSKYKFTDAYYPTLSNSSLVKNSYNLNKHLLVTGPNASGKTTMLKSTLFNILLSQQIGAGFYKSARIAPFDFIHSYINIPDTSGRDSLFQAEARRCKDILDLISKNPNGKHFCIFDELYSGTNPYEAISSAVSFLTYLTKFKNIKLIITTHFLDLCKRLDENTYFDNYHMKTIQINDDYKYTYQFIQGISHVKGGIKVLKDLHYPNDIINNTKNILNSINI